MTTHAEGLNVVGVVQARMGSRRLPGKVLADISGEPMIARIHERLSFAKSLARVVVATTADPTDDVLVAECERRGFDYVRGPVDKLAVRLFLAGATFGADVVVRVWGDCPCVDPWLAAVSVCLLVPPRTFSGYEYAYGYGLEAWRLPALQGVPEDDACAQLYPGDYACERGWGTRRSLSLSPYAFTVDYPDDLERTRRIYDALYEPGRPFTWRDVLALPDEILSIGQHHERNIEYGEVTA